MTAEPVLTSPAGGGLGDASWVPDEQDPIGATGAATVDRPQRSTSGCTRAFDDFSRWLDAVRGEVAFISRPMAISSHFQSRHANFADFSCGKQTHPVCWFREPSGGTRGALQSVLCSVDAWWRPGRHTR